MFKKTLAVLLCMVTAFAFVAVTANADAPAAPTGLTMEYGSTLKDVALSNDLVWTSDTAAARYKLGDNTFYAAYDNNNDGVYEAENIAVVVKVVCTNHSWGEWKADGNEEFLKDGTKTRTCKICGETETVTNEGSSKLAAAIAKIGANGKKGSDIFGKVIGVVITVFNKLVSLLAKAF